MIIYYFFEKNVRPQHKKNVEELQQYEIIARDQNDIRNKVWRTREILTHINITYALS